MIRDERHARLDAGAPTASGCRASSSRTPAAGWPGPSGPTTGALGAEPAQEAFAAVAAAIAASEPVTMAASDGAVRALPRDAAAAAGPGRRARRPTTPGCATSARPSSSTARGGRRGVDWRFNAWGGLDGGLYSPWDRDDRVAAKVLEIEGADRYRAPLVLEGGSIHVDGEGTVLTTEECLLNPNRNPELSREQIERALLRLPRRREGDLARARASSTTRPTATSTTSPASRARASCC